MLIESLPDLSRLHVTRKGTSSLLKLHEFLDFTLKRHYFVGCEEWVSFYLLFGYVDDFAPVIDFSKSIAQRWRGIYHVNFLFFLGFSGNQANSIVGWLIKSLFNRRNTIENGILTQWNCCLPTFPLIFTLKYSIRVRPYCNAGCHRDLVPLIVNCERIVCLVGNIVLFRFNFPAFFHSFIGSQDLEYARLLACFLPKQCFVDLCFDVSSQRLAILF